MRDDPKEKKGVGSIGKPKALSPLKPPKPLSVMNRPKPPGDRKDKKGR